MDPPSGFSRNTELVGCRYTGRCLYFSWKKLAPSTLGLPSLRSAGPADELETRAELILHLEEAFLLLWEETSAFALKTSS